MKRLLLALFCTQCLAAELTLTFEPQLRMTLETNHTYTLYSRESLRDPWEVLSDLSWHSATSKTSSIVYCFYHNGMVNQKRQFYLLLRDDEEPISEPIPEVTMKAPPIPGAKDEG